ncbi:hypothetical protein B0T25DRAFT_26295 [Lasiosphaeria hispida]|uniref:Uncharacterized protein n=1 Tax=Lasiosphaeria hispida TaxID=260671 RepID=A0AAJ0HU70_9PEZI|nr:hypothetical protein B0T25DRAFT_26295 [Lasiosphaeria hispida]
MAAMAAMEAANPHLHHGYQQPQPHPPLPASPTLTNPDMILPDYERSDSPDPDLDGSARGHSPLMMWKNAHAASTGSDMHSMFAVTTPGDQRVDHAYGPTGPITPTTPIIYGNGTMLSDIGEVTEVESTPGKPSPLRARAIPRRLESPTRGSGSDAALRSSPTMGLAAMMNKKSNKSLNSQRERRASFESTSTITTQEQAALFADFDDTASVGDSVFQGDDEESMASSYVEGTPVPEPSRLRIPNVDSNDRLSTYSTTSLSRRAEEILANAKKRLTTMEGNLTRARTSLYITPTAYGSDASTPSPPFQRASTAMHARDSGNSTPIHSPGHSRISSDIAMRNGLPYRVTIQRSQSALGAAGGYRQPLSLSKSADHIRGAQDEEHARPTYKVPTVRDSVLQPLTEDEVAQLGETDRSSQAARLENFLSPTFGPFNGDNGNNNGTKGLQRSASAAQMRDIKDQMKDLKGKISSLREQARVDSMKRRSLQSLRTPSPFTHSQIDQWYAEPPSNRSSAIITSTGPAVRNPWNGEEESVDGEIQEDPNEHRDNYAEEEDSNYSEELPSGTQLRPAASRSPERRSLPNPAPYVDGPGAENDSNGSDARTENGGISGDGELSVGFEDAVDIDYESESGDSMYHDSVQHQLSHEDREDAFDYEHFFLHSAMGTMSQQRMLRRGSTDSYTSEESIETTRGPITAAPIVENPASETNSDEHRRSPTKLNPRSRRNSTASVSTVETFATAEEGRSRKSTETSRDVDAVSEEVFGAFPTLSDSPLNGSSNRPDSVGTAVQSPFSTGSGHPSMSSILSSNTPKESEDSISSIPEESMDEAQTYHSGRRLSAFRRPISFSASNSMHRPSVSSFDSTGTNRSFPLVNKPKKASSTGVLTPASSSPDQELKTISDRLLDQTATACEQQQQKTQQMEQNDGPSEATAGHIRKLSGLTDSPLAPPPMQSLLREDKYLVERLVAGLGKCVLGLTENGRASAESRMYRRRIDAARRMLEGLDSGEEIA